jgi:hypothetical protein
MPTVVVAEVEAVEVVVIVMECTLKHITLLHKALNTFSAVIPLIHPKVTLTNIWRVNQ